MAALSEFGGGLCLIFGFLFGPAAFLMACTMAVATVHHFRAGDGLSGASHALENGILFLALVFIGPGRYGLDAKWGGGKS
jgi:putative oxidoreductase